MQTALALSRFASERGVTQPVHLELESGLNRHGLPLDDLVAFAEGLRALPAIEVEGLFTHFAAAEEGDDTFTRAQFDALLEASARLPWIPMRHCSASASVLDAPDMELDLVRAGIAIYGYEPAPGLAQGLGLRRALALKTRVARVLDVEPGATVGYGRTWTRRAAVAASRCSCAATPTATAARSRTARTCSSAAQRAPIAGRIAMDMCMADVTDIPGVAPDDEVVIIGEQGAESIDADELAALADTISWEILAGISARVPRLYLRNGEPVAYTDLTHRLTRRARSGPGRPVGRRSRLLTPRATMNAMASQTPNVFTYPRNEPGTQGHLDLVEPLRALPRDARRRPQGPYSPRRSSPGGPTRALVHEGDRRPPARRGRGLPQAPLHDVDADRPDPPAVRPGRATPPSTPTWTAHRRHGRTSCTAGARERTVQLLTTLVNWNWARTGQHLEDGRMSIRQIVEHMIEHEADHVARIRELAAAAPR